MVFAPVSRGEVFSDAAALADAQPFAATNECFLPVGAFGLLQSGSWNAAGTVELIDQNWSLLTGHQVNSQPFDAVRITFRSPAGNSILARVRADAIYVHPGCSDGFYDWGDDITLLHLAAPIANITPVVRFRGVDVRGTTYCAGGFGCPGVAGLVTNLVYDGVKRAGMSVSDCFGGDSALPGQGRQYVGAEFDNPGSWRAIPRE